MQSCTTLSETGLKPQSSLMLSETGIKPDLVQIIVPHHHCQVVREVGTWRLIL